MSTSQRTFDQVKSILGKLDQRIDALRERRTSDVIPMPAAPVATPAPMQAPKPAPTPAPAPSRSAYGRATPLRGS